MIIPDTFHQHLIFMSLVLSSESLIAPIPAAPPHAVLSTQHGCPAASVSLERERQRQRQTGEITNLSSC